MAAQVPEYSFVRLNDDSYNLPGCFAALPEKCLPAVYLDDIKFQLITDFQVNQSPDSFIVAFPCQDSDDNAENIFTTLFAGAQKTISLVGIATPSKHLTFSTPVPHGLTAGDVIYISCSPTSGIDFRGFQVVNFVSDEDSFTIELSADIAPLASNMKFHTMPDGFIFGISSTLVSANSEFSGINYAWQVKYNTGTSLPYEIGDCFRLCIWQIRAYKVSAGLPPTFGGGSFLGTSNCFTVVQEGCYNSRLLYGCDEDSFGFYGDGWTNTIRLPMYLRAANYDSEEKGYQKSDGTFKKLAERVNKTYELKVDEMPEEWHDRLSVALSCDTIKITNENVNAVEMSIYKKEQYEVEHVEDREYPFNPASCTVFKGLFRKSVNSNCV